ncbi:hypothetical protein ABT389_36070 [Streptomyces bacillaris]|uniref:hypothetical protein n=1 Tax=Streptomyces bacillaris TaxID=68179 RepID=UPI00335AAACB
MRQILDHRAAYVWGVAVRGVSRPNLGARMYKVAVLTQFVAKAFDVGSDPADVVTGLDQGTQAHFVGGGAAEQGSVALVNDVDVFEQAAEHDDGRHMGYHRWRVNSFSSSSGASMKS